MRIRAKCSVATLALIAATVLPAVSVAAEPGSLVSKWYVMRVSAPANSALFANATVSLPEATSNSNLERLRDCSAQTGVSLVTLWTLRASSLSLQAGRHGEPTLRWSSRSMSRGEASRGLFDSMVHTTPTVSTK